MNTYPFSRSFPSRKAIRILSYFRFPVEVGGPAGEASDDCDLLAPEEAGDSAISF